MEFLPNLLEVGFCGILFLTRFFISTLFFDGNPAQVLFIQFFGDAVFDTCVVRLILVAETINVEDVVPQKVLVFDMGIKIFVIFVGL